MKTGRNEITVDFASNPELGALFSGKHPGDECELTITLKLKEVDEKTAVGTITKVVSEHGYDKNEEPVEPDVDTPVAISVMPMPSAEKAYG